MAILKGGMSYRRLFVKGDIELSPTEIVEKLNLYRFRPLHPRGEDTETMGWIPFEQGFDDEKSIDFKDCLFDDKLVLCLRMDTLRLPKELLKSLVKKGLLAYQRDFNKFPDRTVKKEIEQMEAKNLRARILPKTQIIESIWCQQTGELRIFSRSKTLLDRYLDHFKQTFVLRPEVRDFAVEALQLRAKHPDWSLETLAHHPIFIPPLRTDVQ